MSTDDSVPVAQQAAGPGMRPTGDENRLEPPAVPAGPPWTVELLADLHSGRYPADVADELRRQIAADPWATGVLTALDATVDDLSLLPVPRMPERFALRLDAALAAERRSVTIARGATIGAPAGFQSSTPQQSTVPAADPTSNVPQPREAADPTRSSAHSYGSRVPGQPGNQAGPRQQPGPGRPAAAPHQPVVQRVHRPTTGPAPGFVDAAASNIHSLDRARARRRRWVGGLAAAAAVAAIGTTAVLTLQHPSDPANVAGHSSASAPAPADSGGNAIQLAPGRFGDALTQLQGRHPAGQLIDPATYASCLKANAIDDSKVTGVTTVVFEGKPATAIAIPVDATSTRIVVVGIGCGVDGAADQLASENVTR